MQNFDFDLFVIGAGSGGVRAARMAAAAGARVAIAEAARLGGTCVNLGCVPKKLMVYASEFGAAAEDAAGFGWSVAKPAFDWATLIGNKDREIARLFVDPFWAVEPPERIGMQVSVESGEGLEKRLLVDLPAERVSQVVDRKLHDLAKHVRLDGFRPGKVPMRTIRQRFGDQVRQETYGNLIQETLYEAASQQQLMPAGEPKVELREATEEGGLGYTAIFEVVPEITLADLSGETVIRPVADAELCTSERHCRRLARQARKLLSREETSLDADSRRRLHSLLERSQVLAKVHRSRQQLQQVWERTAGSQDALVNALQQWCRDAEQSGVKALEDFARTLRTYRPALP